MSQIIHNCKKVCHIDYSGNQQQPCEVWDSQW